MGSSGGLFGGSGGGYSDSRTPYSRASSEVDKNSYEGKVNEALQDNLADYNNRDTDKINTHIQTIQSAINSEDIVPCSMAFGGSIKKHTFINGLSDVDMLAIINDPSLADKSPAEIREYFADRVRQRLPSTKVTTGNLAVTVEFSDGTKVQILPAQKTSTGVRIASEEGTSWSRVIHPEKFTDKLTNVNKNNSNGVVPTIKLYKAINSKMPKDAQLSGYHIESIAINAFRFYEGSTSRKAMLTHLVDYASKAVLQPTSDNTGQSIHVDDSLGPANSYERQRASASIQRVREKIRLADEEQSKERWSELL
ncbi:MAG: CBASS oligonucleotide cyclase [Candidatus Bathyarchaeia archaeon]|jgi:hypothetical protein